MWMRDNGFGARISGILDKIITVILIGLLIIVIAIVYLWDQVWVDGA